MTPYSLRHLSDPVLLAALFALIATHRPNTAALLAHLAEVEARRLYAAAGYPSMHAYCVHELGLSEDGAYRRIRVARTAREFPAIFLAIEKGTLNLTSVVLLTPCLTAANVDELIAAAAGKCKVAIEQLLAARFPKPDVSTRVEPLAASAAAPIIPATNWLQSQSVATIEPPAACVGVAPLSAGRVGLQVTIDEPMDDLLCRAEALFGRRVAPGEVAAVLRRALRDLVEKLEKRKFAKTDRPRRARGSADPRHVPAHVRREVWARDGGQCTFVSEKGRRCEARGRVEFDHVVEVARGGQATISNIRLRCRAHNQYAAECTFGADFMSYKRREAAEARRAAAEARAAEKARAAAERAAQEARIGEVVPYLRELGFRAEEARDAAMRCDSASDAPLAARVRAAISMLAPPRRAAG